MSRWANAANQTAAAAAKAFPITFAFLDLDGAAIRAHDQAGPYTWGGNTYIGTSEIGDLESLEEDLENPFPEVKLSLSGVKSEYVTEFIATNFQGRELRIWRGYLDPSSLVLVADPELQWPGVISHAEWVEDEGGNATITLTGVLDYERRSTARWTDVHQRTRYPNDKFFDLLHRIGKWVASIGTVNARHGGNRDSPAPRGPGRFQP